MGATNPAWKKTEREVAAALGGKRRWLSRADRKGGGDIDHPRLEVEVKHRRAFGPRSARAALSAMPDGPKIRVVVHRDKGRKGADAWACYLDLADLWRLHGAVFDARPLVAREGDMEKMRGVLVRVALADLARLVRP